MGDPETVRGDVYETGWIPKSDSYRRPCVEGNGLSLGLLGQLGVFSTRFAARDLAHT